MGSIVVIGLGAAMIGFYVGAWVGIRAARKDAERKLADRFLKADGCPKCGFTLDRSGWVGWPNNTSDSSSTRR